MRSSTKKSLSLATLLLTLFAAGFVGTLTYDAYQRREASMRHDQVAVARRWPRLDLDYSVRVEAQFGRGPLSGRFLL